MTEDEHEILEGLVASQNEMRIVQGTMAKQLEAVADSAKKVESFLYDPPFEGARGDKANNTMAQWLHEFRKNAEAGSFVLKAVLYLASVVLALGGAWTAIKAWAGQ